MSIGDIRQEHVRAWRAAELRTGPQQHPPFGPVTVAKAYRLLRAILSTAVTDKRIRENRCQIKGADRESSPERPVLSVPEVYRLADAIAPRYRALVLLATFGNMRWGELAGLRCRYLDLDGRRVRVVETVYEFGQLVKGTPKGGGGAMERGGWIFGVAMACAWAQGGSAPRPKHGPGAGAAGDLLHARLPVPRWPRTRAPAGELMTGWVLVYPRCEDLPPYPRGAGAAARRDARQDGPAGAEGGWCEGSRAPIGHVAGTRPAIRLLGE